MAESLVLSPSSLALFTECEQKRVYDQALPRGEDGHRIRPWAPHPALATGTATHRLLEARYRGEPLVPAAEAVTRDLYPNWDSAYEFPDTVEKAMWLAERHEEAFPTLPRLIASEFAFKLRHPRDRNLEIQGFADGVVLVDDGEHSGLWVLENKTMSRWDRTYWLDFDPQVSTYMWAAKAQGFQIAGVIFEAIYTYEWAEPRPAEESFRRLWLPYDQGRVDRVLDSYEAAAARIRDIAAGAAPVRNAGPGCNRCDFSSQCHGLA